jgi:hypothetical protein
MTAGPDPTKAGPDPVTVGLDLAMAGLDPGTAGSLEQDAAAWTRRRRT